MISAIALSDVCGSQFCIHQITVVLASFASGRDIAVYFRQFWLDIACRENTELCRHTGIQLVFSDVFSWCFSLFISDVFNRYLFFSCVFIVFSVMSSACPFLILVTCFLIDVFGLFFSDMLSLLILALHGVFSQFSVMCSTCFQFNECSACFSVMFSACFS